jgi:hypothetical protein
MSLFTRTSALRLGMVAALWLAFAGRGEAQNPSLTPTFGSVTLRAGFTPDPFTKQLTAGGTVKTNLGGVNAHVANAPDFRLFYTKGSLPLIIRVESTGDTTLLVNLPNGQWVANDDGGAGLNPMIRIPNPQSGRYDIFVGTFGKNPVPARLVISELGSGGQTGPAPVPVPTPNAVPVPSLPPNFGSVTLRAGFTPDPFTKQLTAGGGIKTNLGGVNAHVSKAPDFRLNYTKGSLPLIIRAESTGDTTILVNLPNGQWIANDDGGAGLNPTIRIPNPQSGRYDIYVGTFGQTPVPARLIISEVK